MLLGAPSLRSPGVDEHRCQASKLAQAQVSMNVSTREYQIVHKSGGSNVSMDGKSRKTNREW